MRVQSITTIHVRRLFYYSRMKDIRFLPVLMDLLVLYARKMASEK
jgi:hypothetical protein